MASKPAPEVKGSSHSGETAEGDSSESDGETEPAKSFHRRISTNKEIKCSLSIKEGYLMKQTSSFQRWRRRYFKIKGRKLYYSKDTKSVIFDEIDLRDLSVAECGTKNINHSWQCITPFRVLVLAADSRKEMESWITALKSAAKNRYYEGMDQIHSLLSGQHNWYATSHARPTYCNICREALSGVTSHGLSCEVCKLKSHKRCAAKAVNNCKWTTLSSVGKEIIEDDDGSLAMPHQWMEGNLPVSAKCAVCDKTCGSVRRLQDWRCLWCKAIVHTACRPLHSIRCPLGPCRVSIVPPTALTTIGNDESWEAIRPQGCSPLLVFVNSKSGDNQGVRFLRRFKQLLNPAQVFDLVNGGPVLGLRLFKCFNPFRILICSGDGSVGWVLSEIDNLNMTNQCQIGVLPLGTGNDLARVLGWGSACDDDAHLPHIIEKYERATTKMLDRWSVMTYVSHVALGDDEDTKIGSPETLPGTLLSQVAEYEDSVANHLATLLQSDDDSVVVSSAKVLCETIKSLIGKVDSACDHPGSQDTSAKCSMLNTKLDMLLDTLQQESKALSFPGLITLPPIAVQEESAVEESSEASTDMESFGKISSDDKFTVAALRKKTRQRHFLEKEALMSRANSLKKAVRQIIEHTENQIDEQNRRLHNLPEIRLDFAEDETLTSTSSTSGYTYSTPFLSTITTTFPLPPASPLPHARSPSILPSSFLQLPDQALHLKASSETSVSPGAISPLPDVRRGSHEFDFPATLPVPSEFADLKHRLSISSHPDDIEVLIQSSNDNLVDDDEPSLFVEEKSISDIRDSLATSLNTSIDIEELDDEELDRGERGTPDGGGKDESAPTKPDDQRTEKDSGDSEDTDDTVKEKGSPDEHPAGIPEEVAPEQIEIIVPVPLTVSPVIETSFDSIVINVPDESRTSPVFLEVPTDTRCQSEGPSDSSETSLPSERIVEGAEASSDSERAMGFLGAFSPATRRVSTGAALKLGGQNISLETPSGSSSRDKSRSPERSGRVMGGSVSRGARKNLPIINPLVSLPMWPNIASGGSSGGLISKVLLANADALCAAASPLMDLDDSSLEGYNERCVMNNYFGIGIDAKITLDFHNKREEHPEKCRSRTKNFMWYGVLASKEWLCKTYKNFDQRVQLECDGERIPLPSLQGIVVLNIPSFMGGTNFWGGKKEHDSFLAPSFDDRILEVVAVFGSAQMAASRIINLQHHRIAQCSSIKITVLGEEGVPVQVDGEAWTQPPGIIRIVHKNRVQMLCRSRELEVSLKAWEEKQQSLGRNIKQLTLLTDEEIHCLDAMARMAYELLRSVRLAAATTTPLEALLTEISATTQARLDKVWRDCRVIEGPNLRMLATEFVHGLQKLHCDMLEHLKDGRLVMTVSQEDSLRNSLLHVECELKKAHEMDNVIHFEEEAVPPPCERKRSLSKGALFKLKLKREALRGRGGLEGQVREWGLEEVASWLDKLDLSEHKEAFISNDIRGAELLSLERRDLKELGVTKIGHIKRFQQAVKEIRENKSNVI